MWRAEECVRHDGQCPTLYRAGGKRYTGRRLLISRENARKPRRSTRHGVRDNESMTIVLKPDQEKAIQEAINAGFIGSVDEFIDTAIGALPRNSGEQSSRANAVRRMQEFGETHKLNLGERISRKLFHEGHRI